MKKLLLTIALILCSGLAEARNSSFDEWWFSTSQIITSLIISNYYQLTLTSPTTFSDITATNGGMLYVDMNVNTNLYVSSEPSPTNINGIIPWIMLNRTEGGYPTTNFAQYFSGGIHPFRLYNTNTAPASYATTDNVRPSGTMANTGLDTKTINSLVLDSATPFAQCRTDFTLQSGGLIINKGIPYLAPSTASSTDFTFPVKGYIWMADGTESYISFLNGTQPIMSGTNGLVITGNGQLLFDTFGATGGAGQMYINQSGNIWLNTGAHFGAVGVSTNLLGTGDCTWYLQGGVMLFGGDGNVDYDRPVVFRSSNSVVTSYSYLGGPGTTYTKKLRSVVMECCKATFEGWGATQISGRPHLITSIKDPVELVVDTEFVSRFASEYTGNILSFQVVFESGISGAYNLTLSGGQYISFYGSNTYSGATTVNGAVLNIFTNSALAGTSRLNLNTNGPCGVNTGVNAPVNKLFFKDTEQLSGTHGGSGSSATYKNSTYFGTSAGIITVTNGITAPTEYDLVLGIGQSNMNGMGDLNDSPATVQGVHYQNYGSSTVSNLVDPTAAIWGSCVPAFANSWFTNTGRGVIYIYGGGNMGSSLIPAAEPSTDYNWTKGDGYLYTNAVALMNNAITSLPTNYPIANKVVLWIQGEQDGTLINSSNITAAIYEQSLVTLITNLNADITGGIDSFRVSELGATTNGTYETEWASIRTAQSNAVAAVPYAIMPFTGAKNFPAEGKMVDNVHYDQVGLNEVGVGLASGGL